MKIGIIGAQGQLGSDLQRLLPDAVGLSHRQIEITNEPQVHEILDVLRPTVLINCAAYNLVDQAEVDSTTAFRINAVGPKILAQWCHENRSRMVQISTDYVFGADSARTTPYKETDAPGPLSVYANSKLAGERAVQQFCSDHLIIRTCGLYGQNAARSKGNFVTTMLRLGQERSHLRVVDDQRCTPSWTEHVAQGILNLIQADTSGLFHLTNSGSATWYEVACETFRIRNMNVAVEPIPSSEYPTKASRPAYSVLDCSKYSTITQQKMPDWNIALEQFLNSRS